MAGRREPEGVAGVPEAGGRPEATEAFANPLTSTPAAASIEPADIVSDLRRAIAAGQHWFVALLEAVGRWQLPEETVDGRHYSYVIGGEAFDWLLLAERLCESLDGAIPAAAKEALLFTGLPPLPVEAAEMRRLMGEAKYRAHLNFFYGVIVEEALHLAVEEEALKEQRSSVWQAHRHADEEAFLRIYGQPRLELLRAFCANYGLPKRDRLSLVEMQEFTYWLFKYRLKCCDPARVASDTRKALLALGRLQSRRQARARAQAAADGLPRRVIDV